MTASRAYLLPCLRAFQRPEGCPNAFGRTWARAGVLFPPVRAIFGGQT